MNLPDSNTISFQKILTVILVIVYGVGVIGISQEHLRPGILPLTAYNLMLSLICLYLVQRPKNMRLFYAGLVVFTLGMCVEILGVSTGVIFGQYYYGENLGRKVFGVPWIIGANWLMLVWSTAIISSRLSSSKFIVFGIGATFMVFLDMLIEPLCEELDYWHWVADEIPIQNFFAWWISAYLFQWIFHTLYLSNIKKRSENSIAWVIYTLQVIFFSLLNIFLN